MKGFFCISKTGILINDIRLFGMFILVPFKKRTRQIRRRKTMILIREKLRRWFTHSSKKTKEF